MTVKDKNLRVLERDLERVRDRVLVLELDRDMALAVDAEKSVSP